MIEFVTFTPKKHISTLVCCSIAALLSACGGGASEQPTPPQPRTAGYLASSDSAPAQAVLAQPDQASATAAQAPVSQADFALQGYASDPVDRANQDPAMSAGTPAAGASDPAATPAAASAIYVSPKGNDNNAGTSKAPLRSLGRAARATKPGSTVYVAPGTYDGGFKTATNGTASARIAYVSTSRYGARIVTPANSTNNTGWDNRGNYVDIVGFQIDGTYKKGTRWTLGIYNGGSYDSIRSNWVHDIAKGAPCTSAGGSAIGVDSYYGGVQSDVIGNLVNDIGPAGCRYVQGIYISTSGSVKNNVVYRVAEGAIHLWHDANNVIITNNTVANSNTGIIIGGGDFYKTKGPNDNTAVYSNIVYDNKMGISEQGKTGRNNTYRNNLVFQNATYNWKLNNGLTHSGTVSSAPQFVNYTRSGTPDLHLDRSSPAIGRASATHAHGKDYAERPRNHDTGFDIGAYQH